MAFSKILPQEFRRRLTTPPEGLFDKNQQEYLKSLLRDTEKAMEQLYTEARRVATTDKNPQREAVSLNGKSGSIRVDLKHSQLSKGAPVVVYADALSGDTTITGFDNAYNWTIVLVLNLDATYSITIANNSEHHLETGADQVLTQYDVATIIQATNAPLWLQSGTRGNN